MGGKRTSPLTPHALAAPQLTDWGKNTDKLLLGKIIY